MKLRNLTLLVIALGIYQKSWSQKVQGISTGQPTSEIDNRPVPEKGFGLHVDYVYGVIDNRYEIQRQYKSGIGMGLIYRTGQWFSVTAVLSKFQRHDAFALKDCQGWSFDVDGQLTMRIAKSDMYFRMIYGIGYTDWKGYYVGPNLNDNYHYYKGKLLKDQFYTGNIGWGFSHFFCRQRMEGFGDFRLKFAADPKVAFAIRDTQFHFGIRYHLGGLSSGNGKGGSDKDKDGNANRKPNREKKRRVYKWMKGRN